MNSIDANLNDVNITPADATDSHSTNSHLTNSMERGCAVDEITMGDVYDQIADRLAEARMRALMGERQEALGLMQAASLEYIRFREVLKDYPGHHALEHAFSVTLSQLCGEQVAAEGPGEHEQINMKPKSRRKADRAA